MPAEKPKVYVAMSPHKSLRDSAGQAGGTKKLKVYIAMSGGVDSSVATALLKKQANPREFEKLTGRPMGASPPGYSPTPKGFRGYEVTGIFFKPWLSPDGRAFCNWRQDQQDAMRVAAKLDIKFKVWDFSKEYGNKVTKYTINSYRHGITPNPDVMCNKEIKFGLFLKKALVEGADFIATGHYVRIKRSGRVFKLLKGKDPNKDQSYFLWTLAQKQLKYCLFPIGDYTKPEVRKLAKKFGLHTHAKKDSQGICFVGQLDVKEFLKEYIKSKEGEIKLLETGKTIGRHDGVYYYTIGQRHGMNISIGGGPYFVTGKDIKKNILFVTNRENSDSLRTRKMTVGELSWVDAMPKLPIKISAKIRYRTESVPAVLKHFERGILSIEFNKPVRAITPGQSAVFYNNDELIGGGVIQ